MLVRFRRLTDSDKPKFNELARTHGTIFNTTDWTDLFDGSIQHFGLYNGREIVGGFVLFKERKLGLDIYCNPPFTPVIGPFVRIDAQNPVSILSTWKKALQTMTDTLEEIPFAILSISLDRGIIDAQPFIWKKYKVNPQYTYLLDLRMSIECLWKNMSNERRKNIRKGTSEGLECFPISDPGIIRSLVMMSFDRQKKKINEDYLDKVLMDFARPGNSFAFTSAQNGSPLACSFCVYDDRTAYYLFGGYDHTKGHHGAGTMCLWESIKYAQQLGLKRFDFEGSMVPEIERYFRGFGGELKPYHRISKAKLPLEIALKFRKRELF